MPRWVLGQAPRPLSLLRLRLRLDHENWHLAAIFEPRPDSSRRVLAITPQRSLYGGGGKWYNMFGCRSARGCYFLKTE